MSFNFCIGGSFVNGDTKGKESESEETFIIPYDRAVSKDELVCYLLICKHLSLSQNSCLIHYLFCHWKIPGTFPIELFQWREKSKNFKLYTIVFSPPNSLWEVQKYPFSLQLYRNHTSACVFSCKFAAYFWNSFPKNTSGGLLLKV